MGGPFDILYRPRVEWGTAVAPKKRGPKPKAKLTPVVNTAPSFNTQIATTADSQRTRKVRGRGLK